MLACVVHSINAHVSISHRVGVSGKVYARAGARVHVIQRLQTDMLIAGEPCFRVFVSIAHCGGVDGKVCVRGFVGSD